MRKYVSSGVEYKGFHPTSGVADSDYLLLIVHFESIDGHEPFLMVALDDFDAIQEVARFLKESYGIELSEDMYAIYKRVRPYRRLIARISGKRWS